MVHDAPSSKLEQYEERTWSGILCLFSPGSDVLVDDLREACLSEEFHCSHNPPAKDEVCPTLHNFDVDFSSFPS
ncbi:hypothetical protein MASR2M17_14230 [Aminivibrio sp.]